MNPNMKQKYLQKEERRLDRRNPYKLEIDNFMKNICILRKRNRNRDVIQHTKDIRDL